METKEVLVEAISPFGFMVEGKWLNLDKSCKIDPKAFHKGDALELSLNGRGFIIEAVLKTAAPPQAPKKPFVPRSGGWSGGAQDPEKSNKMARGAAVKAVLESQFVYDHIKDKSLEEGLKEVLAVSESVADYIESGLK